MAQTEIMKLFKSRPLWRGLWTMPVLKLALGVAWTAGLARAEKRLVPVEFELVEAIFDKEGKFLGDAPKPDVFIRVRPDQWQAGPGSRHGYSEQDSPGAPSRMKHLLIEIPGSKPPRTAFGHLELVGNLPQGPEVKFFLWQHGYEGNRHDQPFEIERHQPSRVTLVPVANREDYFNQVIRPLRADSSLKYFSSLVSTGVLDVQISPEGAPLARSFAEQKRKVVEETAKYWQVDPADVTQGFDMWQSRAREGAVATEDQILATAYAGDLGTAVEKSAQDRDLVLLNARLNLALSRDLLAAIDNGVGVDAKVFLASEDWGFMVLEFTDPRSLPKGDSFRVAKGEKQSWLLTAMSRDGNRVTATIAGGSLAAGESLPKAGDQVMVTSGRREELLKIARDALGKARTGLIDLGVAETPRDSGLGLIKDAIDKVLLKWRDAQAPPARDQMFFIKPPD